MRSSATTPHGTVRVLSRVQIHVADHRIPGRVKAIATDGAMFYVEILGETPVLPGWEPGQVVQCSAAQLTLDRPATSRI